MKTRMLQIQILSVMMVLGLVLSACQPQVVEVEKEVVVTQVVREEVEVEKIVEVEKVVEVEVEKIVEVEKGVDRAEGDILIAFANMVEGYAFSTMTREGIVEEATARGWETLLLNNNFDPNLALTNVDTMILQEVDVAIEFQLFEDINPAIMAKFNEAGIPMITIDIPAEGAIFAGVDNYEAGRMGGDWLGQYVLDNWDGDADLVLLLDDPTVGELPAKRVNGVEDGILAAVPGLKDKVLRQPGGGMREKGLEITRTVLTQYPDAHRIIISGIDDISLLGALAAAEELGREDDIIIFGQGGEEEALPEIRDPDSPYLGDVAYFFENYGKTVIAVAEKLINGEPIEDECPDWRDVCVFVDIALLTKDNINEIYPISTGSELANVITIAHSEYAFTYDPLFCNWSDVGRICAVAYDSLVKFDPSTKQIVPHLAKEWSVSADAKTYTFTLEEGVKFHDGTEVTASDVKYSIERMKALDDGAASLLAPVASVDVVDDYTVDINLSGVSAPFLMSLPMIMVVNQQLAESVEVDGDMAQGYLMDYDLGSGPYTVVSTVPEQEAVLEKFDDYWRGWEGDHIDGIIFQWIKESATQRLTLESGQLDIMMEPVMSELAELGAAGYQILEGSSAVIFSVDFRTTHPPLDNILVRKALAHAVDYDYHIEVALAGYGIRAKSTLASELPYFNDDIALIPFDMDKAQELLAEAGYPDGGFTLKVAYESAQDEKERALEMVQQNWGALGITIEPIGVDWMVQTEMQGDPDSEPDVYLGYIWPAAAEPDTAMREYWHGDYLAYGNNAPYWSDPQVDALFEKGLVAQSDFEREGYYREIQELVAAAVPHAVVSEGPYLIVAQPWVNGYVYNVAHHQAVDVYNMQLVGKP